MFGSLRRYENATAIPFCLKREEGNRQGSCGRSRPSLTRESRCAKRNLEPARGTALAGVPAGLTTCDLRRRKRRLLQNPSALQSGARQGRLSLTIAEWESGTAPQNIRVGLRHPHRNLPLREAAGRQSVRAVGIGSECGSAAGTHAVRCAGCRKEECRIWVFSHRVSIVRHS